MQHAGSSPPSAMRSFDRACAVARMHEESGMGEASTESSRVAARCCTCVRSHMPHYPHSKD